MAKFLDTTGVSYHLQQLVNNSKERLILISPYLKINDRIKQLLEDKDRLKIDVRVIYGKSELDPAENDWLKSMRSIRSSFCQNLHAKCYLNEREAIITSMNLCDFSQVNNNEIGIYISKDEDESLYSDIYEEAMRLARVSEYVGTPATKAPKDVVRPIKPLISTTGSCIRCHTEIPLNPMVPYCKMCYKAWKKFGNDEYEEKFCHICGERNASTLVRPACHKCWKKNKDVLDFPLVG